LSAKEQERVKADFRKAIANHNLADGNTKITIDIAGHVSREGTVARNEVLAKERCETVEKLYAEVLKEMKIKPEAVEFRHKTNVAEDMKSTAQTEAELAKSRVAESTGSVTYSESSPGGSSLLNKNTATLAGISALTLAAAVPAKKLVERVGGRKDTKPSKPGATSEASAVGEPPQTHMPDPRGANAPEPDRTAAMKDPNLTGQNAAAKEGKKLVEKAGQLSKLRMPRMGGLGAATVTAAGIVAAVGYAKTGDAKAAGELATEAAVDMIPVAREIQAKANGASDTEITLEVAGDAGLAFGGVGLVVSRVVEEAAREANDVANTVGAGYADIEPGLIKSGAQYVAGLIGGEDKAVAENTEEEQAAPSPAAGGKQQYRVALAAPPGVNTSPPPITKPEAANSAKPSPSKVGGLINALPAS
jgi:hypothetical protein